MRKKAYSVSLLVMLTVGCSPGPGRSLDAEAMADEFASSPSAAVAKYRQIWDEDQLTELDRTTLAGELLSTDAPQRERYLAHIYASASSDSPVIVAAAANALRSANDNKSLDLLENLAQSDQPQVARAAAHSLNYMRQNMDGGKIAGSDAASLNLRIARICARSSLAGFVEELLCKP